MPATKKTIKEVTGLNKTQVIILQILLPVGKLGGITRNEIARRAEFATSLNVYQVSGWPDEEKRKQWEKNEGHKSLLTLGYVKEETVDIDGRKELVLSITAKGIAAMDKVKTLNKEAKAMEERKEGAST